MSIKTLVNKLKHSFEPATGARYDAKVQHAGQQPQLLEVNKWVLSKTVKKLSGIVGLHPYPFDELMLMAAAFQYHAPNVVIDIGTHIGKSARIWHELSRGLDIPAAIHTIDLQDPQHPEYPGAEMGRFIKGTPVIQHLGDGVEVAREIIKAHPEAVFLMFLDGDHAYEKVRRELELAKLIDQGCFLVHDTFFQLGAQYNVGPYEAIQDFVRENQVKQVVHLQTGLPGMSYLGLS